MARRTKIWMVLAVAAVALGGCTTPEQRLYASLQMHDSICKAWRDARVAHLVDDKAWARFKEMENLAWAYMTAYKASMYDGKPNMAALDAFNHILDRLVEQYKQILQQKEKTDGPGPRNDPNGLTRAEGRGEHDRGPRHRLCRNQPRAA